MGQDEKITTEPCGCEFTEYIEVTDKGTEYEQAHSCCFLTKCRCQKHYDEQFIAEWYDAEGHHRERFEPANPLPMER